VQQVILEKQTLDVFDNPNTEIILQRLQSFTNPDAEFVVFGVVTEYCVRLATKGLLQRRRRVALVSDAIETLNPADGQKALDEVTALGARFITTDQALALVDESLAAEQEKQPKGPRSARTSRR
jgi:nicotinamidase/pyrazinamidase